MTSNLSETPNNRQRAVEVLADTGLLATGQGDRRMTTPSTEELQRLLDEATPGEWQWDDTVRRSLYSEDAEGKGREIIKCAALLYPDEPDAEIIAHSRVLAAEVIRLREAIADAKSRLDDYMDAYHKQGQFYTSARLRNVSKDLAHILEGDQA